MYKHLGEKCGKLCISSILSSELGKTPTKIDAAWWHKKNLKFIKRKSYTKFQLNMISKYVGEKWGKLCISSILSIKGAKLLQKFTQINDTQSWSDFHKKKVIYTISAQYVKACRRKVRKTVYFQCSKFRKGHNSYRNWLNATLLT